MSRVVQKLPHISLELRLWNSSSMKLLLFPSFFNVAALLGTEIDMIFFHLSFNLMHSICCFCCFILKYVQFLYLSFSSSSSSSSLSPSLVSVKIFVSVTGEETGYVVCK